MIAGIDVGVDQGHIGLADWHVIYNQGKRFLVARCQEGLGSIDPTFSSNIAGASTAGFVCGAYFPLHCEIDAVKQAESHFAACKGLGFGPGSLAPWCDSELTRGKSNSEVLASTLAWCLRARELWGRKPTLYSFPYFLRTVLAAGGDLTPLAEASNLALASYQPNLPLPYAPWKNILFWQQSGGSIVPGVPVYRVPNGCPSDYDQFPGDDVAFANACDPGASS